MLSVVLASAILAAVLGVETDPTKICLPERFQAILFLLGTDEAGSVAFDFTQGVIALSTASGLRTVFNLTTSVAYAINETDGLCRELPRNDRYKTISARCLPASAIRIGNVTTYVGFGNTKTEFFGWEYEYPGVGIIDVALTDTKPAIPILRQFRSLEGQDSQVIFFFNANTDIDDLGVFKIPDDCPPLTVVG